MERLYIGEEYLALENKRVATLRYFVVEQSKSVEDSKEGISTYGLEVEKWNGKKVERECLIKKQAQVQAILLLCKLNL